MPRPKEFNVTQALDHAMQLFWERGYEATSMRALLNTMGISRQSLYDTFGNKHQLFLAALDRYRYQAVSQMLAELEAQDAGLPTIEHFLHRLAHELTRSHPRHACLMINTLMEMAPQDTTVAARVGKHLARMRCAFRHALDNAIATGQLEPAASTDTLANMLICHTQGCTGLAKGGTSYDALVATLPLVMASLGA